MNAAEWLCLWYLRLNGYFTTPTFIVHGRQGARTDVDVLAVRFPHSSECRWDDDDELRIPKDRIDVIFAEAKTGQFESLNGPWSDPGKGVLNYVLRRVGIVPTDRIEELAARLYKDRRASEDAFTIRICAFGKAISPELAGSGVHFVCWRHVLQFVYERFRDNDQFKADHGTWDRFGQYLWRKLSGPQACEPDVLFRDWNENCRLASLEKEVPRHKRPVAMTTTSQ
jgi:hypothetical protein